MSIISAIKDGNQIIGEDSAHEDTPELLLVRVIDYDYKISKE
jgi:hypothetical protein